MCRGLATLLLLGAAACSSPLEVPASEVLVIVDATSAVRARTTSLTVQVSASATRDGPYTMGLMSRGFGPPAAQVGFPRRLALIPLRADATRFFEVQATAFTVDPMTMTLTQVATTVVRSGYVAHRLLQLTIVLDSTPCASPCAADQTCRHGVCSAIFIDPSLLPDADAGTDSGPPVDAGDAAMPDAADGGVGDGGSDGGDAGCSVDRDCIDGDECDGEEKCIEGSCEPGTPLACDDGIVCTVDGCNAATGCTHVPTDARCVAGPGGHCDVLTDCQYSMCDAATCRPDGPTCMNATCMGVMCVRTSACTTGQQCCGGACIAACDDGNVCTDDSCDAPMARCVHVNNTAACSDMNACTNHDKCNLGTCRPGSPVFCDDGNTCTFDTCVSPTGCHAMPLMAGIVCDDGNECTSGDRCVSGGTCVGTMSGSCDDGNPCTTDMCGAAGACLHSAGNEGAACTDLTTCADPGFCSSGVCTPGVACPAGTICCPGSGCIDTFMPCA